MKKRCLMCGEDTSYQDEVVVVRLQFKSRARWVHSTCFSLCDKHEDCKNSFKVYLKDDYYLFKNLRGKLK